MAVRDHISQRPVAFPESITISVGVHAEDGAQRHTAANDTGETLTVSDVATFNEFGLGVPQRSFIRAWYDEDRDFVQATLQSQFKLVIAGKLTAEKAAERCALAFEGRVKQRIARGIPPPNAPSTVAQKGSSKPLIDTGMLRGAIRSRVTVTR